MAFREGLRQVISSNHTQIIVEKDSKILIDSLMGTIATPWQTKFFVQDILRLASYYSHIWFVQIWREANFIADAIAKAGHYVNVLIWECSLPLSATNVFHLDKLDCNYAKSFVV